MEKKLLPTVSVIIPTYNRKHLLMRAIESALSQTLSDIEVIIADDEDDVYRKTMNMLRANDNIQALYITNGFPCAAARAIDDSGRAGKVKLFAFDHNQDIFRYIKKGIIAAAIGQDAFGQGHDPIVWLYNNIAADEPFPGEFIPCRLSVVDKNNVESLIEA